MHFRDIPGLEEMKRLLTGAVRQGHVAHALLFAGNEGGGALPLALAFAAYLNCLEPTETDSCGTCSNCVKMHKHIHPDVHFVLPVTTTKAVSKEPISQKFLADWRTFLQQEPYGNLNSWMQHIGAENKQGNISKEESRQLIRVLSLKAFEAPYKIILLWQPELLHPTAANALLKILEEPPAQTVFLLVSYEADQLLPTISSRLQRIQVRPFSEDEISQYLQHTLSLEPERALQVAQLAEGSLQAALQLSTEVSNDYFVFFRDWMRACYSFELPKLLSMCEEFQKMGRESQKNFLQYALTMLRKVIMLGASPGYPLQLHPAEEEFVKRFAGLMHAANREALTAELEQSLYHIERNANPKIIFFDSSLTIGQLLKQKPVAA